MQARQKTGASQESVVHQCNISSRLTKLSAERVAYARGLDVLDALHPQQNGHFERASQPASKTPRYDVVYRHPPVDTTGLSMRIPSVLWVKRSSVAHVLVAGSAEAHATRTARRRARKSLVITGRGGRRRRCALARGNADAQRLLDANDHWRGRRRGALPPRGCGGLLGGGLGGLLLGRLGPRGGSALAGLRLLRCGFLGALLCEELLGLFDELGIVVVVFSLFVRGLLQLSGSLPVLSRSDNSVTVLRTSQRR